MTTHYSLKFKLPGLPEPVNRQMVHWRNRHAQIKKWKAAVALALADKLKPPQPLNSATLTLVRNSSVEPDYDGLVSGFKAIVDALVEQGVLKDDKMSVIGQPKYEWRKAPPGKGFVSVRVEAMEMSTNQNSNEKVKERK